MGVAPSGPNVVEIQQEGCGGNLGFCFPGPFNRFTVQMDPRLAPYLAPSEYKATVSKMSETILKYGRETQRMSGVLAFTFLVMVGVVLYMGSNSTYVPEHHECTAANGECSDPNGATTDCCKWWCCGTDARGVEPNTRDCTQISKTDELECMCQDLGRQGTQCGETRVQGPKELVPEKDVWAKYAQSGSSMASTGSFVLLIVFLLYRACGLKKKLNEELLAWNSKGIAATYYMGAKRSKARIVVILPQHGPQAGVTGSPIQGAMVQSIRVITVQVPPGSGPGQMLQVQTPDGQTIAVTVPPNVYGGSQFDATY